MNPLAPRTNGRARMSAPTVSRLTTYLGVLTELHEKGRSEIMSADLARLSGTNGVQLRKDFHLAGMRNFGVRGQGYGIDDLLSGISQVLKIDRPQRPIVIIGAGHLGEALAGHSFTDYGFAVIAIFDEDDKKSGTRVGGIPVFSMDRLQEFIDKNGVDIAVIAVPINSAQGVADLLERTGVSGILNFAPTVLAHSDRVVVRNVDLTTELIALTFETVLRDRREPHWAAR